MNCNSLITDTIAAIATPMGRGGVGIIRVSGSQVIRIMEIVLQKRLEPRLAFYGSFIGKNKEEFDRGIALFFPRPHSFTGEDVLELHGHGGPIVLNMLLKYILHIGARQAHPGEFTERAFLNGKMDLTQIEAVADLIDSVSEQQALSAMRSLQGVFSEKINEIIEDLTRLRIFVEGAIDFSEEDIDFLREGKVNDRLITLIDKVTNVEKKASEGVVLKDGLKIAILGPPNSGKSSLLNALAEKDVAIVSDIKGTTRDVLNERILIDGLAVHVFDTAGLCETNDKLEKIGVEKAFHEVKTADIVFFMVDGSRVTTKESKQIFLDFFKDGLDSNIVIIRNKIDLTNEPEKLKGNKKYTNANISVKTGCGIKSLKSYIKDSVNYGGVISDGFSARYRHVEALVKARRFLLEGQKRLQEESFELLAEDLKSAQNSLGEITGIISNDELLGNIFSDFCIGK